MDLVAGYDSDDSGSSASKSQEIEENFHDSDDSYEESDDERSVVTTGT